MTWLTTILATIVKWFASSHATITPVTLPTPPPTPSPTSPSRLERFCLAIQHREGFIAPGIDPKYPHGTPAWRNNNPGNCRWPFGAPYPLGATGIDTSHFLIFDTYLDGFGYLFGITREVCNGTAAHSGAYQSKARILGLKNCAELTIQQYFVIRDPASDNNDPHSFAVEVAQKVGLPTTAMMKQVLL